MANHCSANGGPGPASRSDVRTSGRAVEQTYARWDGQGVPGGLAGEELSLSARISHVADACEVLQRTGGVEHAVDVVRSRSGTHFDPHVVAAVVRDPELLFVDIGDNTFDVVLEAEPIERPPLTEDQLDAALEAVGDFCDLRCPYFAGHARGTAELVVGAAALLQVPPDEQALVRRAALIHDVGRFGVPGGVWDQAGPLSVSSQERMRMHVYYVERIFSRPEPLRRIGLLAATHHERMDGSGYHRGVGGPMLSMPARILAVADAYHAMMQPRPHRGPMTPDDAASQLRSEVDAGRLDATATAAVLEAAGHESRRLRGSGPVGLTPREVEVLALLTGGLPNKSIARQLGISAKTVSNHIDHIYAKLGVSNRAGAAMQAMQYGLVGPT